MKKAIIFIVIIILAVAGWWLFNAVYGPQNNSAGEITVKAGESLADISADLQSQKYISDVSVFKLYEKYSGLDKKIVAGTHSIPEHASLKTIATALSSQTTLSRENSITFIEGWTAKQIGEYLLAKQLAGYDDYTAAISTKNWQQYDFLQNIPEKTIEGFIFPDTYRVFKTASAQDIIKKALDNFSAKLTPELRAEISRQGRSIHDVVTLASVVQEEARTPEDMRQVADIFLKRIAIGQGLQSDATVVYAIGGVRTNPTAQDLALDSPYNTYKYRGLPLGPICNPGLDAIKAVIYPAHNDYYYFLYGQDGKIYYAKTYDQHLVNVRKYLR